MSKQRELRALSLFWHPRRLTQTGFKAAREFPQFPSRDMVNLQIDLVLGDIIDVEAPVAVCAHQDGVPLGGSAKSFDLLLDSWLSQVIDFQMIGGRLGQVFFVSLEKFKAAQPIRINELLLVGLGEPGQLAPDDLRFVMSNVTTAIKVMGFSSFVTSLIGTRGRELSVSDAVRSLVEGVLDGYRRLRPMGETAAYNQSRLQRAAT